MRHSSNSVTLTLGVVGLVLDRADEDLEDIALGEHGAVARLAAVEDVGVRRKSRHLEPRMAPADSHPGVLLGLLELVARHVEERGTALVHNIVR